MKRSKREWRVWDEEGRRIFESAVKRVEKERQGGKRKRNGMVRWGM